MVAPHNVKNSVMKSGKADDVYFSKPNYVCLGDPYLEAKTSMRQPVKDGFKEAGHEVQFRPAKMVKE